MALKMRKSPARPPPPGCPMSACMSLLGGTWTPNVIWQLDGGPRRFGELQKDIPGISAKMLSVRLQTLRRKGVLVRRVEPSTSPPSVEYSLSELGKELVPVIDTIVAVGTRLHQESSGRRRRD
jgi:DNA-binding HxlR family transcriptional regulator